MNVDMFSNVPKFYRFKEFIKENIIFKSKPHTKILSEKELAKKYNINITTVNKAISILVEEGYLYRIGGKGTYVAEYKKLKKMDLIGVVVPDVKEGICAQYVKGIIDYIKIKDKYNVVLYDDENDYEKQYNYINRLLNGKVHGLIIVPLPNNKNDSSLIKDIIKKNVKLVFLDRYTAEFNTNYVVSDNLKGMYELTKYLIEWGHRRIGFILTSLKNKTVIERLEGYKLAFKDSGVKIDENLIVESEYFDSKAGKVESEKLIKNFKVTAIIGVNDLVSLGVVNKCSELGIKIPDELSIGSYDDLDFAEYLPVPLTTVHQPGYEMGKKAAEIIVGLIENKLKEPQRIKIPSFLIKRDSCAPVRE